MRISLFGKIRVKYTKLSHLIDSKTTYELDNIDNESNAALLFLCLIELI